MLVCPKCATRYEDTHVRSLCPRCLISLQKADQADALTAFARTDGGLRALVWAAIGAALLIAAARHTLLIPPGLVRFAPIVVVGLWMLVVAAGRRYLHRMTAGSGHVAFFMMCGAGYVTYELLWDSPARSILFQTAGLWSGAAIAAYMFVSRSTVGALTLSLPSSMGMGIDVPYRVTVTPAARVRINRATLLLLAEERSKEHSECECFRMEVEVCRDEELALGRQATYSGTFHLPEDAPPSLKGDRDQIEWFARLWVGVAGWRPDPVAAAIPTVLALVPRNAERAAPQEATEIPAPGLAPFGGRLSVNAVVEPPDRIHLRGGESVDGHLRLTDLAGCTSLELEVVCTSTVSGEQYKERHYCDVITLWEGDSYSGGEVLIPLRISVPSQGPPTYRGELLSIDWVARVRAKTAEWTEIAFIPLVVRPAEYEGQALAVEQR